MGFVVATMDGRALFVRTARKARMCVWSACISPRFLPWLHLQEQHQICAIVHCLNYSLGRVARKERDRASGLYARASSFRATPTVFEQLIISPTRYSFHDPSSAPISGRIACMTYIPLARVHERWELGANTRTGSHSCAHCSEEDQRKQADVSSICVESRPLSGREG